MKIYSDDPNLPYKTTKLKALYTRSEIDGLFAKWGVKDVYWRWDLEGHEVYAIFKIKEEIEGHKLPSKEDDDEKDSAQTDGQTDNAILANKAAIENLRPLLAIFEAYY